MFVLLLKKVKIFAPDPQIKLTVLVNKFYLFLATKSGVHELQFEEEVHTSSFISHWCRYLYNSKGMYSE